VHTSFFEEKLDFCTNGAYNEYYVVNKHRGVEQLAARRAHNPRKGKISIFALSQV